MAKSIEEIKKEIEELLKYRKENYIDSSDEQNFVIPFIAMNDGHTPAQVRAQSKGIYKDIQRSPFVRKTGVFTENGTIQDIDISSLVYYGTLQQSKIAPTLENVDIKLYFREPSLTKVPDTAGSADPNTYADKYIWREIQPGFHVYNNDTVYGYEWLVLQSDYVSTDGIYNLHMNIEDGLGVCKFAGTQAPISLKGVQYKIVITAKNLWNREFSLLESMPLIKSLDTRTDDLAPSVNAVREYYEKALETLKVVTQTLLVKNSEAEVLMQDKDGGIYIKNLTLGEIENTEEFIKGLDEGLKDHISQTVDNVLLDDDGNAIGVHGLVNKGAKGNLNAKSISGATLSNGAQSVQEDVDPLSYIPFVDKFDTIGYGTTVKQYKRSSGKDPVPYYQTVLAANDTQQALYLTRTSLRDELKSLVESVIVGATTINYRFTTLDKVPTLKITSGKAENGAVTLQVAKVSTDEIDFGGGFTITANRVAYWNGQSSIAYKNPHSELLNSKLRVAKNAKYAELIPNIDRDADGNFAPSVQSANINSGKDGLVVPDCEDVNAWTKLGSALQALYELPLGTYQYKRGGKEYKEQLGIFIERVNQVRDYLAELRGSGEDATGVPNPDVVVAHKRNTLIKSSPNNILNRTEGLGDLTATGDSYRLRIDNNAYTYTDEEVKSIVNYLNLLTSKDELSQEIRNTVGVLLMAAKETQERLLDVETAVYGWDAKTVPGSDEAKKEFINGQIAEALQDQLNNSPFLLGLNRLMRAILLEIYDTTDLEKIDAEIESRVTDSDTLAEKATVKSRMDQVDEIASVLYSQVSAIIKFYSENIASDESSHTYREMTSFDKSTKRISKEGLTEDTSLQDAEKVRDDHSGTVDIDVDRTWKNLPTKEDVESDTKESVGFGKVADSAHKHTPNLDETGLVRVPVKAQDTDNVSEGDVDHTDVSEYVKSDENESGETRRFWDLYKLDKSKTNYKDDYAAAGSYSPFFKTKLVAWEQAKVERMNTKLSELTKTIYGTDDVSMKYPNRTEVLRRNITNLVDDLYPNRFFKIENPINVPNDSTATLFGPFKVSNLQNPKEGVVTEPVTDEPNSIAHTSIIKWFNNEIFNFKIINHYIGDELQNTDLRPYRKNTQIQLHEDEIDFDASKLVTDETPPNLDYGSYKFAYSRLDLLEDLLGVEDCYISKIFAKNILSVNDLIAAKLDESATGYTSAKKIGELSEQEAEQKTLKSQYLLSQATVESEISIKNKEKDSLTTVKNNLQAQKVELENKVFDKGAANAAVEKAKKDLESANNNLTEKQTEKSQADVELEEAKKASGAAEAAYNNQLASCESLQARVESQKKIVENFESKIALLESTQKLTGKYKPLQEAKDVAIADFSKALNNTELSLRDFATLSAMSQTVLEEPYKGYSYFGSESLADNSSDISDEFTLTIERSYKKGPTVYSDVAQREGGEISKEPFPNYDIIRDYYTRTDEPNKIYLAKADCENNINSISTVNNIIIVSKGNETSETLIEAVYEEVTTPPASEGSEETDLNETEVTTPSSTEMVLKTPAVYLETHINAFVLKTKESVYKTGGEIVTTPEKTLYEIYSGKIYHLSAVTNTRVELVRDVEVQAVDLGDAETWEPETGVEYYHTDLASVISDPTEYLDITGAKLLYAAQQAATSTDLEYGIKYTLTWEDKTGTASQTYPTCFQTDSDGQALSDTTKTEHAFPRVYEWKGKCTVNLLDANQTSFAFTKSTESYTCNARKLEAEADVKTQVEYTAEELTRLGRSTAETLTTTKNDLNTEKANLADAEAELAPYVENIEKKKVEWEKAVADENTAKDTSEAAKKAVKDAEEQVTLAQAELYNKESFAKNLESLEQENQRNIDQLNTQIAATNNSIEAVENDITRLLAEKDRIAAAIVNCETKIAEIRAKIAEIEAESEGDSRLALPLYAAELKFNDYVTNVNSYDYGLKLSDEIQDSSNVGYVVSRKEKPIQARITTIEAFLDLLGKAFNYSLDLQQDEATYKTLKNQNKRLAKNVRFESVTAWKALKRVFEVAEHKEIDPRIFDLDLSESWKNSNYDFSGHNDKVWQFIAHSKGATKGPFTYRNVEGVIGSYTISNIKLVVDTEILPYQDTSYLAGWEKFGAEQSVEVVYLNPSLQLNDSSFAEYCKNTKKIYLKGKIPTSELNTYYTGDNTATVSKMLGGASGWQNQTEYNIYKTISNLFNSLLNSGKTTFDASKASSNNLYYTLMLLAHPVGSIYMSTNGTDPKNLFGGTWEKIEDRFLIGSSNTRYATAIGGINDNVLTIANLPKHTHDRGTYEITGTFAGGNWRDEGLSGAFTVDGRLADNDGWPKWHPVNRVRFTASRTWTGESGATGGDEPFTVMPAYYTVNIWRRIS